MPNTKSSLLDNPKELVRHAKQFKIRSLSKGLVIETNRPLFILYLNDEGDIYFAYDLIDAVMLGINIPHSNFTFSKNIVRALQVIIKTFKFIIALKGGVLYEIDEEGNRTRIA